MWKHTLIKNFVYTGMRKKLIKHIYTCNFKGIISQEEELSKKRVERIRKFYKPYMHNTQERIIHFSSKSVSQ